MRKLLLILAIVLFQVQHAMAAEPEAQPQSVETSQSVVIGTITPQNPSLSTTFWTLHSSKFSISTVTPYSPTSIPLDFTVRRLSSNFTESGTVYTGRLAEPVEIDAGMGNVDSNWTIDIHIRTGEAHLYDTIQIVVTYDN